MKTSLDEKAEFVLSFCKAVFLRNRLPNAYWSK
jgi:hypothetical protein